MLVRRRFPLSHASVSAHDRPRVLYRSVEGSSLTPTTKVTARICVVQRSSHCKGFFVRFFGQRWMADFFRPSDFFLTVSRASRGTLVPSSRQGIHHPHVLKLILQSPPLLLLSYPCSPFAFTRRPSNLLHASLCVVACCPVSQLDRLVFHLCPSADPCGSRMRMRA